MTIHDSKDMSEQPGAVETPLGRLFIDHMDQLDNRAQKFQRNDPKALVHDVFVKMTLEDRVFEGKDDFLKYARNRIKSEFLDQEKKKRNLKAGGSGRDGDREAVKVDVEDLDFERVQGNNRVQFARLRGAIDGCLNVDGAIFELESVNREEGMSATIAGLIGDFRKGDMPRARRLVGIARENLDSMLDQEFGDYAPGGESILERFDDDLNAVLTKELFGLDRDSGYEEIESAFAGRAKDYIAMRLGIKKVHRGEMGWMALVFKQTEAVIAYLDNPENAAKARALLMQKYLGLSLEEVAGRMALSVRQVRYLIERAMDDLKGVGQ